MARTDAGRRLTEEHRLRQNAVAGAVVKKVLALLGAKFDLDRIDESALTFARQAAPVMLAGREHSADLTKTYLEAFHAVETAGDDLVAPPDLDVRDSYDVEAALAELLQTVISVAKSLVGRGYDYERTRAGVEKAVTGRTTRVVADAGRALVENEVRRGQGAVGYARVVDADPCPFCSMLASRGVYYAGKEQPGAQLYRSDSFGAANARFVGDGEFKVHDGCQCTLEPVYYRNDGSFHLPGNGDELAREWAQVAAGAPDPAATWRRWRESGTLPPEYEGPLEQVGTKRDRPDGPTGRSITRSPGQAEGTTRPARDVPKVELTRETVERYLSMYEARLEGLNRELAELADRGLTEGDLTYLQLKYERDRLVKRVSTYREYLG